MGFCNIFQLSLYVIWSWEEIFPKWFKSTHIYTLILKYHWPLNWISLALFNYLLLATALERRYKVLLKDPGDNFPARWTIFLISVSVVLFGFPMFFYIKPDWQYDIYVMATSDNELMRNYVQIFITIICSLLPLGLTTIITLMICFKGGNYEEESKTKSCLIMICFCLTFLTTYFFTGILTYFRVNLPIFKPIVISIISTTSSFLLMILPLPIYLRLEKMIPISDV